MHACQISKINLNIVQKQQVLKSLLVGMQSMIIISNVYALYEKFILDSNMYSHNTAMYV